MKRAEDIEGWMGIPELVWLRSQAHSHVRIVEIGSFLGRSTTALAEGTLGRVWAVDDWESHPENVWPGFEGDLYQTFIKNIASAGAAADRVTPVRGDHALIHLLSQVVRHFDMVFIDGAHDYESVCRDIKWALANVESGGLVCGHDYCEGWPGVRRAVDELVPGREIVEGTSIWAIVITKGEQIR